MRKKNLIFTLLIFLTGFASCNTNKVFLESNSNTILDKHLRVAILPFRVVFSDGYKKISTGNRQGNWQEQQRVAGLDLQKDAFTILTKRAAKKQWTFTVQDFLTTNKILQKEDIRFSELPSIEKGKLAKLLDVDAVIWGETTMEFNMNSFGNRNGMNTKMQLFDAASTLLIWQNEAFQELNGRTDSPKDLSNRSVSSLINSLPYKKGSINY